MEGLELDLTFCSMLKGDYHLQSFISPYLLLLDFHYTSACPMKGSVESN